MQPLSTRKRGIGRLIKGLEGLLVSGPDEAFERKNVTRITEDLHRNTYTREVWASQSLFKSRRGRQSQRQNLRLHVPAVEPSPRVLHTDVVYGIPPVFGHLHPNVGSLCLCGKHFR